jgi:hypothetical protein
MSKIRVDSRPVAVYDVSDKKLVLLFSNASLCGKYLSNNKSIGSNITIYISTKSKCYKNRFDRTICFRSATDAQIELLGGYDYKILDERFHKEDTINILSKFNQSSKREFTQKQIIKYSKIDLRAVI